MRTLVAQSRVFWRVVDVGGVISRLAGHQADTAAMLAESVLRWIPKQLAMCESFTSPFMPSPQLLALLASMPSLTSLKLTVPQSSQPLTRELIRLVPAERRGALLPSPGKEVVATHFLRCIGSLQHLQELWLSVAGSGLVPVKLPPKLRCISLGGSGDVSSMFGAGARFSSVQELSANVSSCRIEPIADACPEMTSFSCNCAITQEDLDFVLVVCDKLRKLDLAPSGRALLSLACIETSLCAKLLTTVSLIAGCFKRGSIGLVCHSCPNIETLTVSGAHAADVCAIATLQRLRDLDLSLDYSIKQGENLGLTFVALGYLDGAADFTRISLANVEVNSGVAECFLSRRFSNLRKLRLINCRFTTQVMCAFAENIRGSLVELSLCETTVAAPLLMICNRIKYLRLDHVNKSDLLALGERFRSSLKCVKISDSINDPGLIDALAPALAGVFLFDINFTAEALLELIPRYSSLEWLHLPKELAEKVRTKIPKNITLWWTY
jgi:hypothetical protein